MSLSPKISIVGGGPGDPELITVKALKALQSADVILYDALINTSLLDNTPPKSKKIFVGKRAGKVHMHQTAIEELMVDQALKYGHVVRLKGGDPYVFGRGYEEFRSAKSQNVEVEVIPGISSALAAPASVEIPVTLRGVSQSFWVLTATEINGSFSSDLKWAVRSSATIIILMGLKKLPQIVDVFIEFGLEEKPVMVVQDATLPTERSVKSTIKEIEKVVLSNKLRPPATIIIGKVVDAADLVSIKSLQYS